MPKLISACGLVCSDCPALKATHANDADAIAKIAVEWSQAYHADVRPEHVWCDGCMTTGSRKCHHASEGEICRCVVGRKLNNCAACPGYACATLGVFLAQVPPARAMLEELRSARG